MNIYRFIPYRLDSGDFHISLVLRNQRRAYAACAGRRGAQKKRLDGKRRRGRPGSGRGKTLLSRLGGWISVLR